MLESERAWKNRKFIIQMWGKIIRNRVEGRKKKQMEIDLTPFTTPCESMNCEFCLLRCAHHPLGFTISNAI